MKPARPLVLFAAWVVGAVAEAQPTAAQSSVAEALFNQGRALMREGRYAEGCERLAESQRLDPSGGTLLNLASCRQLEGRTATAHALFTEALAVARTDRRPDRVEAAQLGIAELEPVLSFVVITVSLTPRPAELRVKVNGADLPEVAWGTRVAVDPGTVTLEVSAPGYETKTPQLTVEKAAVFEHEVTSLARLAVTPRPAASRWDDGLGEIAWRPGLTVRVDIDGELRGASAFVGATVGITEYVELGVGALLGGSFGFEVAAGVLPFEGFLRPIAVIGCVVFFEGDTPHPGFRAGAGVEWFVWEHLSILASSSAVYFPTAPGSVDPAVFVPSVGVVGRL